MENRPAEEAEALLLKIREAAAALNSRPNGEAIALAVHRILITNGYQPSFIVEKNTIKMYLAKGLLMLIQLQDGYKISIHTHYNMNPVLAALIGSVMTYPMVKGVEHGDVFIVDEDQAVKGEEKLIWGNKAISDYLAGDSSAPASQNPEYTH